MEHAVKYTGLGSKPPAIVEYYPELHILFIWTGQKSAVGEEIVADITVHYDKDEDNEPASVVAIHIDSAEYILKPFVDSILAKYDVSRETEDGLALDAALKRKAAFEATAKYPIWKSSRPAQVEYCPERNSLFIDSERAGVLGAEMAENVTIHYDKDDPDEQCSAVAIHIDNAEHVLKPFVDAILAKYDAKREEEPAGTQTQD